MSSKKWLTHHKKVIKSPPEPENWRFFDFATGSSNPISNWVSSLSEDGQSLFWSALKNNHKVQNPIRWTQLRYLQGEAKEHRLWELRFTADKKAHRVIGYFCDNMRMSAILLIGCTHKQNVYNPPDPIGTAIKRKKLLESGEATAHERQIPIDR
jgi:hypothetical protein